jgi:hypothetical protein
MLLLIEIESSYATFFSRSHTVHNIVIIQKPCIETEVSRQAVVSVVTTVVSDLKNIKLYSWPMFMKQAYKVVQKVN